VKVDGTAGKDKLVGKVSAGVSDLLGMFPSCPQQGTHLVQLTRIFSPEIHRLSLRGLLPGRVHNAYPRERSHLLDIRRPNVYLRRYPS
jgi:hypothetical protein